MLAVVPSHPNHILSLWNYMPPNSSFHKFLWVVIFYHSNRNKANTALMCFARQSRQQKCGGDKLLNKTSPQTDSSHHGGQEVATVNRKGSRHNTALWRHTPWDLSSNQDPPHTLPFLLAGNQTVWHTSPWEYLISNQKRVHEKGKLKVATMTDPSEQWATLNTNSRGISTIRIGY